MIAAAPVNAPSESYLSYIEHIPPEDGPQMFGMHVSVSDGHVRSDRWYHTIKYSHALHVDEFRVDGIDPY